MQRRLDTVTGVNKPFENVSCQGPLQHFFRMRAPIFVTFSSVVFSAKLILSNLGTKTTPGGSDSLLPRKIYENLHTVMAILVLFEQFLRKGHIFDP